jgi:hypothetical protein
MKSKLRRKRALKLDITNVLADGAYTAALYIGRKKTCINVYLDTGSSTFVVDNDAYNPSTDINMKTTKMALDARVIHIRSLGQAVD